MQSQEPNDKGYQVVMSAWQLSFYHPGRLHRISDLGIIPILQKEERENLAKPA